MKRQKKAVLVTLDVQGAFDAVLHGRLLQRMNKMGWPKPAITWIKSFLQERSARVRHEDGATDPVFLECGLPQGSPLSPILFLRIDHVIDHGRDRLDIPVGRNWDQPLLTSLKTIDAAADM